MNPFLPTTMTEWLILAAFVITAAFFLIDTYRMNRAAVIYENRAIPSDELRTMISNIVDDGLRADIHRAVIDTAEDHPVTREVYDKIVSRMKNKAIGADQVASLATTGA